MLQWWPTERDGDDKALRCDCGLFCFYFSLLPIPPPMESWRKNRKRRKLLCERNALIQVDVFISIVAPQSNLIGTIPTCDIISFLPQCDSYDLMLRSPSPLFLLVFLHPLTLPHISNQCQ